MMMNMVFYSSCEATILVEGWMVSSCGPYLASLVAVLVLGILRQFCAALRIVYRKWARRLPHGESSALLRSAAALELPPSMPGYTSDDTEPCGCDDGVDKGKVGGVGKPGTAEPLWVSCTRSKRTILVVDGVLFFVSTALALLNMLVAMTYNVGLFLAVCLGEAIGVMLFSPPVPLCACQRVFSSRASAVASLDICH